MRTWHIPGSKNVKSAFGWYWFEQEFSGLWLMEGGQSATGSLLGKGVK